MKNIETTFETETAEETMKFIESKRNWDVENQRYRKEAAEKSNTNLADCQIYWRGKYLILEHDNIIHYWDSFPYCFLKMAVEFMELEKPEKWKTLQNLISFRMAIRQTEVNWCGYVDDILCEEQMSEEVFKKFMKVARKQDKQHHGSHTF